MVSNNYNAKILELEDVIVKNVEEKRINMALETLNEPYTPIVYAIPKEQWEAMLTLQTGMVNKLSELNPYWEKTLNRKMNDFYAAQHENWMTLYRSERQDTRNTISEQFQTMTDTTKNLIGMMTDTNISHLTRKLTELKETLRHRDMWEPKLKAKWVGIGALISMICFILLKLLKVW